jgi:phenylpyruvate tautomerase PptA (4-oxalocrotonate tautomerase family)
MSRDYIVTKISWPSYGSRDLAHAADMLDVITDALTFAKKLGEPCFVTKLLQTKEERVNAEIACAKEVLINAITSVAQQTFARKRRTQIKVVLDEIELSKRSIIDVVAPLAQLRKNKIDMWTHTLSIDSGKIEINIVMTPSSVTFIMTKIA